MSDFRDRAKDAMDATREKAADAMNNVMDIARDQLDTFKKLDRKGQGVVLAVIGAVVAFIFALILWPHSLQVTVEMVPEPITGNNVAIMNNESQDLGATTITIDGQYEITLAKIPPGHTASISLLEFHHNGNPNGATPNKNMMPRKITVQCRLGSKTRKFSRWN